ncbi:hypothetical protein LLE49_22095 [Alicyclobacillus tolerans]|uniref:hypothetical protein n=1 Tax=Alicyclobacillus tolerans TaxID=90970 RepID=UPI001F2F372A|nr:hypothetical protein [Alicyclobacillus tolerans]MCF8567416.1 hypothetical protein [Alicyclobacillus tolerans]
MVVNHSKWRQAAFIAVLVFFFISLYAMPFQTGDSIWSNVIGQWIVTHHRIPTHDHWAWTAVGQKWTPQEWGFEVMLYLVNHALGFLGVVLLMSLISVLTWVVFADVLKRQGRSYPRVWAIVAAALSAPWDQIRAETFSYLFFALTLWIVERDKPRRLLWLLPLEFVWVNLHGSFALGIGLVLWMGLSNLLPSWDWGWLQHQQHRHHGRQRLFAAVGMGCVSLINPQGWHMYVFAYWLSFQTHISHYILEWQPATITELPTVLLVIELGLFMFLRLQRKEPVQFRQLFWALGTLYMFMKAVRFGSYALLTTPWAFGSNLPFESTWLKRVQQVKSLPAVLSLGLSVGCTLLALQSGFKIHGTLIQNAASTVDPKVVEVVANIHRTHPNWRMWNGYGVGDALESAGLPVSIDGRTEVYLANGWLKTYMDVMQGKPGTLKTLHQQHIDLVCVAKQEPLSELLSATSNWVQVYHGKTYVLFERKTAV